MKAKKKMTEIKEEYKAQAPQLDEAFMQAAQSRMLTDSEHKARELRCWQEINAAIAAIAKRYSCAIKFVEVRENGQTVHMGLQPVAQDQPMAQ